jgi:Cd2+/Zn2+-exporting ATPase
MEQKGLTTAVLGSDHQPIALLGVADTARPEAAQAITKLRRQGARVIMLTGDRKAVAEHIAAQVGISEVYAELLPEDKLERIKQLRQEGTVVMVGDGLNDAPALNAADVGVSMAAGSDVSLESADLVLMKNDLNRLVGAQQLARATARTVYFNLSFALGVIVVVGAFALAGQVPLPLGVVAHEGGTVFVVLVGLRLLAHRVGS